MRVKLYLERSLCMFSCDSSFLLKDQLGMVGPSEFSYSLKLNLCINSFTDYKCMMIRTQIDPVEISQIQIENPVKCMKLFSFSRKIGFVLSNQRLGIHSDKRSAQLAKILGVFAMSILGISKQNKSLQQNFFVIT